jgi:AcrR family transcriptional regulator
MTTRPYRSSVREQAAAVTRNGILDAAEQLFAAHGYARITIARVAEEADVAANTVYATFGSKAALVIALTERGTADPAIGRALEGVSTATDGAEIVRIAAAGAGATVRNHLRTMAVLYDNETADPQIAEAARHADALQRERLAEVVGRLAEIGALREGLGTAEATDVLWYHLNQGSWRMLRRLGWGWERCEEWLTGQVIMTLLPPAAEGLSSGEAGPLSI